MYLHIVEMTQFNMILKLRMLHGKFMVFQNVLKLFEVVMPNLLYLV